MNAKEKAKWRKLLVEIAERAEEGVEKDELTCALCKEGTGCNSCILIIIYDQHCMNLAWNHNNSDSYGKPLADFIRNDALPKLDALEALK